MDNTTRRAARAALLYVLAEAGHEIGDYVLQTTAQATRKAAPGHNPAHVGDIPYAETWRANQAHVATYHLALAGAVAAGCRAVGLRVRPRRAAAAFAVSYLTHSLLDRRVLVDWLMDVKGAPRDAQLLRVAIDQAGHKAVLAALAVYLAD